MRQNPLSETMARVARSSDPRAVTRPGGLIALLEITRPTTSLGAGLLALLSVRITVLNDSSGAGLWDVPRTLGFAIGWFMLAQAVFAVNDAFDAPIDAISHPTRAIPAGRVRRRDAMVFGVTLGVFGSVVLASIALPLGIVALLYGVISWYYSARLKAWQGLVANATVAGLIALVPLSIAAAGSPLEPVGWLPAPIFLGVLAREILNDIEDADGDRASGRPTLPITLGNQWAYRLSAAIWIGFVPTVYLPMMVEPYLRTAAYVICASLLNAIVFAIVTALLRERADLLARLQLVTKLVLFAYVVVILVQLHLPS
jgi:geranylgeranylglycerol-phosphate geranylgeranyltransferase